MRGFVDERRSDLKLDKACSNDSPNVVLRLVRGGPDTSCLSHEVKLLPRVPFLARGTWPFLRPDLMHLKVFVRAGRPAGRNCRPGSPTLRPNWARGVSDSRVGIAATPIGMTRRIDCFREISSS